MGGAGHAGVIPSVRGRSSSVVQRDRARCMWWHDRRHGPVRRRERRRQPRGRRADHRAGGRSQPAGALGPDQRQRRRRHRHQRAAAARRSDADHRRRRLRPSRRRVGAGPRHRRRPHAQRPRARRRDRARPPHRLRQARHDRLQGPRRDHARAVRARGRRPQRADEARRDVLHQPAGLAAQREARRRVDDRRRDRPAHHGRHQPAGVLPRRVADAAGAVAFARPAGARPSDELGPKLRAALARSVTVAEGEVWIGKDDHVLRKALAHGKLVVAERDRDLLYGLRKASIAANLAVSEIGAAHTITAPRSLGSYDSLQLTLSALAESVRKDARHR